MSVVPGTPTQDREIADLLVSLSPEVVALLAAVVTSDAAFEGVRELRDRFKTGDKTPTPTSGSRRMESANSVSIDPAKWRHFFWRRRTPLNAVGPMMEPPRCDAWGSVIASKRKAGYYALDDLACALNMRVEDLIEQVGADCERARLSVCV